MPTDSADRKAACILVLRPAEARVLADAIKAAPEPADPREWFALFRILAVLEGREA